MTTIYQWYSWPQSIAVNCSRCGKYADLSNPTRCIKKNKEPLKTQKNIPTNYFSGRISCLHCGLTGMVTLQWPVDAFYSGNVRGKTLWAWNLEHAQSIKAFILSIDRNYKKYQYSSALYHLPDHFKLAKNRGACYKTLDKMITKDRG